MPAPVVKGIRGERQRGTPAGPEIPRITCGGVGGVMVYVCEVCESAPATVTCKADAAALCPSCDADIHSANPLARRHLRVPIYSSLHASKHLGQLYSQENYDQDSSWLSEKNSVGKDVDGIPFGGVEVDEYLDLVEYGDGGGNENENIPVIACAEKVEDMSSSDDLNDSVVPEQDDQQYYAPSCDTTTMHHHHDDHHDHDHDNHQEQYYDEEDVDQFDDSCKNGYPYMGHVSMPHSSISMPSLDVGIVPEASMTESAGHFITLNSPMEVTSLPLQLPLSAMDREARVLRYRMKRKNRKFEKTIRYASRKAYAETRPRIKGRFAKRTDADAEVEVDQMFSSSIMVDTSYGLVPSY